MNATSFISGRRNARSQHAAALAENGWMLRKSKSVLRVFKYDSYAPEPGARDELIARARAVARNELQLNERLALLAALTHTTGLSAHFDLNRTMAPAHSSTSPNTEK